MSTVDRDQVFQDVEDGGAQLLLGCSGSSGKFPNRVP